MAAIAHSPEFAKKAGVPMSVGRDFIDADKGKKFRTGGAAAGIAKQKTHHGVNQLPNAMLNKYIGNKEGGIMHSEKGEMKQDITQDKKLIKKAFGMHDKQLHESKKTNLSKLNKGGMAMKKFDIKETMGPRTMAMDVEKGSNVLTKFGQSAVQKRGMTKGKNLGDSGKDLMIQGGAKKGSGTFGAAPVKMARGGGIETKGKTKGKFITMCGGGMKGKKK